MANELWPIGTRVRHKVTRQRGQIVSHELYESKEPRPRHYGVAWDDYEAVRRYPDPDNLELLDEKISEEKT